MDSPLAELDAWWEGRYPDDDDSEVSVIDYTERGESVLIDFETVGGADAAQLERAGWR